MGTVRPTDRHKLFADNVARKQSIIIVYGILKLTLKKELYW
jgi:hypothetical protein